MLTVSEGSSKPVKLALVPRSELVKALRRAQEAEDAEQHLLHVITGLRNELQACQDQYRELASGPDRVRARRHLPPARIVASSDVPTDARILDVEPS